MPLIDNRQDVLHRIRIRLYPNNMPGINGTYLARTVNDASL